MVAFANSGGGMILIGVDDSNAVSGLSGADVHRLNAMISNVSSTMVEPPINVVTENISHPAGLVLVVNVPDGINKPYMDNKGVILVKTGADKRRAISREEIQRMFQQAGIIHADETPVAGTGAGDLDLPYFDAFFAENYGIKVGQQSVPLPQLVENMNLAKAGSLNLAGVLLFSRNPDFRLPIFMVKAVSFPGMEITDAHYIDSRDIVGKLADIFQQAIGFVIANLGSRQGDRTINSAGEPEIPRIVWEELIANALVHRDYFVQAPIRILVFSDRVEIISPGHLPNNLTVANIRTGNSNIRNPIIASFAAKLLPYRGLGSGVLRALKAYPSIDFTDDRAGNLFKVVVTRT
jgi:ATP-dependent DNA helicase RecG